MKVNLLSLAIASLHFLTFKEKIILQKKLDNIADLAVLSIDDMSVLVGRKIRSRVWNGKDIIRQAEQSAMLMKSFNILCLHYTDILYPAMLREIFDPPFLLFYRGNIKAIEQPCVSVVGTRRPSVEGMKAAFDFAKDAALDGVTVVSGLALGIDACVHKGVVAVKGKSVGVLPCGADAVFPATNRRLALAMLECDGCLITEYLPGVQPSKFRFPQRNRIISALSSATLVVEAPKKSGALITADFALEQGRDVYIHQVAFSVKDNAQGVLSYETDGAPVIKSYAEYLECRKANPGTIFCKQDKQLYF